MVKQNVLIAVVLSSFSLVAANLVPDPGFEEPKSGWEWSTPGKSGVTETGVNSGKRSFRLFTSDSTNREVAQLFSRPVPLDVSGNEACKLNFSFRYKGDSPTVMLHFLKKENGKYVPVLNGLGKPLTICFIPKAVQDWTSFEQEIPVAAEYLKESPAVRLQFQRWSGKAPTETFLDDVSLEIASGAKVIPEGAANLLPDPGFEASKSGWEWRDVKKSGYVEDDVRGGKRAMRLFAEKGDKVSQLFSHAVPLNMSDEEPCSVRISFWYKGGISLLRIHLLQLEGERYIPFHTKTGDDWIVSLNLKNAAEWTQVSQEIPLSREQLSKKPAVRLQFMLWPGKDGTNSGLLDDVAIQTVGGKALAPYIPQVNVIPPPAHNSGAAPMPELPYRFGVKDGYMTRNGKPFYYAGNYSIGGGQWQIPSLWTLRLLNYSMCTLDWSKNFTMRRDRAGDLNVTWQDSESCISAVREATRYGMIIEFDAGNYTVEFAPDLQNDYEFIRKVSAPGNHFYGIDHNTPEGRGLIYGDWASRFRFMKQFPLMAFEVWNELGYRPSHDRVLRAFRDYAKKKYGTLEEANRVWRKEFRNWEEVLPPHLSREIMPGVQAHQYRIAMREKYFEMYYDWLRFVQLDFVPGFQEMKKLFRTFSDAPYSVDWRGHRHYSDGYGALDIDLLDGIQDVHLLHTWIAAYDYLGRPADSPSVLNSITTGLMFHNFLRTNSDKPIMNPEDIVSYVGIPGSKVQYMRENCLAQFPAEWKFRLEEDCSGVKKGYFKPEFDDSAWGAMAVPGCWDETETYKGRKGVGWYRAEFKVSGGLHLSYLDGSRKFYLYGKGVAQRGTVWVNGVKVGEPAGWNEEYQYDIGAYLRFGGNNQITFMVDGSGYSNGLRFYLHVLADDMINERRPFGKKEYASRLWTYMMQGGSAVTLWNWEDTWRPFMPEVVHELNSVSEIAMPAARETYPKMAGMLMPYLFFRGLPVALEKYYLDYMNYFGALAFHQIPTAVFTEKNILKAEPEKYPVIFYPAARIVHGDTFAHMKRYVEKGGTAVITLDSMLKTFDRYEDTDVEAFAGVKVLGDCAKDAVLRFNGRSFPLPKGDMTEKNGVRLETKGAAVLATFGDGTPAVTEIARGKGRVVFIAANVELTGAHALVGALLEGKGIEPTIRLTDTGDKSEFPYLEGKITGTPQRFLAYLHNWGGRSRDVAFAIPERLLTAKTYRIRNVRDVSAPAAEVSARQLRNEGFRLKAESGDPAAYLFEDASIPALKFSKPDPVREKVIRHISEFDRNPGNLDSDLPKALFFSKMRNETIGRLAYPQLTESLKRVGVETWEFKLNEITPALLKKFDLVFLGESHMDGIRPLENPNHPLYDMLIDYVRGGGSLLIVGTSAQGSHMNGRQQLNQAFGRKLGWTMGPYAKNPDSCGWRDSMQVKATDFAPHPVAQGVKAVQFFTLPTYRLKAESEFKPLILTAKNDRNAPDLPVAIVGTPGKGKAIFLSDGMWMQPFRVEEADNARLMMNMIHWLTGKEIKEYSPQELSGMILLTDREMTAIEERETKK